MHCVRLSWEIRLACWLPDASKLSWCVACMQTDPSPVRKAAGSPQASVRQRAAALLKLLGADSAEAPAGAPRGAQPASAADLMGGMDEPGNAAAAAAGSDLMGKHTIHLLPCCLQLSSDAQGLLGHTHAVWCLVICGCASSSQLAVTMPGAAASGLPLAEPHIQH